MTQNQVAEANRLFAKRASLIASSAADRASRVLASDDCHEPISKEAVAHFLSEMRHILAWIERDCL